MSLTLLLSLGGALGWGLLGAWAQAPGSRFPDPQSPRLPGVRRAEAEDIGRDPVRRNWCPYQKPRLVTFIAACNTEKFFVRSEQPCPPGAADCQRAKVMYRVARKPVYRVQQKVLASVAWRCCPGFAGSDCQHSDPAAVPEPADPGDGLHTAWEGPVVSGAGHPAAETSNAVVRQGHPLRELQNDMHHMEGGPPGPEKAPASNLTAAVTEANQGEPESPGRSSEQVLHFSPVWSDFNHSLNSLFETIRNLSLAVEANRQTIRMVQDSTVPRVDFQELGAKFETKVQENAQRVGQLQKDVEDRLHAQQLSLHHTLSQVQADVDAKLKRLLKAQEQLGTNGSLVPAAAGAGARPEPESLQARLSQLQRNLSALHLATSGREEALQNTLEDMRATLAQHRDEIKELYSESDETFDQISKVEQQMQKLQVNHQELRELRVVLMEKSLIMEENKVETEQQLLELNLTLQHLQGSQADFIKYVNDCSCQKLPLGPDGQEDAPASPGQQRQAEDPSLQALGRRVAAVSRALEEQQAEAGAARAEQARLRTQLRALSEEAGALRAAEGALRQEAAWLRGSFSALLEDALRHEALLAALFGDELVSEAEAGPLPLSYEQIRAGLQDAAVGLREQAQAWDALAARVAALEPAAGRGPGLELPEPGPRRRQRGPAPDPAGLARELQRLGADVQRLGQCCQAPGAAALNGSLEALRGALAATQRGLEQHQQLFHRLVGNFQGLLAANVSLDLEELQALLLRKGRKQPKGQRRGKKQAGPWAVAPVGGPLRPVPGAELQEAGSPVAFYASLSEEMATLLTVIFDTTYINIGSSYFPGDGYFRAPERGVYLFAVSVEFGPGPGAGQLVIGGHRRTPVCAAEEPSGRRTATTFAMAQLQKGERVWFELTQGSLTTGSPSGTAFGGFLLFRT
ncbi:LOW QUALITY PROTEIN: multimerin-2 [Molossus nigricans]